LKDGLCGFEWADSITGLGGPGYLLLCGCWRRGRKTGGL